MKIVLKPVFHFDAAVEVWIDGVLHGSLSVKGLQNKSVRIAREKIRAALIELARAITDAEISDVIETGNFVGQED